MTGQSILVIEDEPDIRGLVSDILTDEGYEIHVAESVSKAREACRSERPDLILLDVWLPDGDGIGLLREWKEEGGTLPCPVVMMSGHGTVETAVEATRLGAYDFIEKPLSMAKLILTVARAIEADRLSRENIGLRRQALRVVYPEGSSPVMQALRAQAQRIARHDAWVLISGEPGTGKQTLARYMHSQGRRRDRPFVEVAVAALTGEDAAADLFGREQGPQIRHGLLEHADGGILFLDEVADMDLHTQGRLLSALESQSLVRIGGAARVSVDVQVVAATQGDLAAEVAAGRFREDFYYRLSVVPLHVPPLREHIEDLPDLIDYYADLLHAQEGLPKRRFSPAVLKRLRRHEWPGNIRELRNLVQRLMILGTDEEIAMPEIDAILSGHAPRQGHAEEADLRDLPLREARERFERDYLLRQLERTEGNITRLAETTGLERTHLYRKLRSLGIEPRRMRSET